MPILGGSFLYSTDTPSGWTHIILVYIGPEDAQGIRIYHNGLQTGGSTGKNSRSNSPGGNSRVVVGRLIVDLDNFYPGLEMDELLFFNEKLTDQQVRDIFVM